MGSARREASRSWPALLAAGPWPQQQFPPAASLDSQEKSQVAPVESPWGMLQLSCLLAVGPWVVLGYGVLSVQSCCDQRRANCVAVPG